MNGAISTFKFDDMNCECMCSADPSVQRISKFLYQVHDDFVDHPISVSRKTWNRLLRVLVFLDTQLVAQVDYDEDSWPFTSKDEWEAHRGKISELAAPQYDPKLHSQPVDGPWERIPTIAGLGILGLVMVIAAIIAMNA